MTDKTKEALKLALEALEENHHLIEEHERPEYLTQYDRVISAVVKALAEESSGTEQPAPVAWFPPAPPPECKSEAEKTAFAFGWFKALEAQRALDKKAENARELGLDYEPTQPQQEPVAKRLDLLERGRILAANQRDLDLTAGKTVAKMLNDLCDHILELYTSPPASKPLTNEEIENVWERVQANDFHDCVQPFARAIEAKLREKNNV